jgi:GT2 family glycosyltransferase
VTVTVVLATVGRPAGAAAVAAQVVAQLPADGELVVVDQSAPADAEALRAALPPDPRVLWRPSWPPGLPRARNVGLRAARGDVVWFVDDDVALHPGALAAHLAAYADPRVGCVAGRIVERRLAANSRRLRNDVGWDGRIHTRLDVDHDGVVATAKGANMSFRRAPLLAAGGFDPGFAGTSLLEDADASRRVAAGGWRIHFVAAAAVDHEHAPTGGARRPPAEALRWRLFNTGRYLRRHRGWAGVALALVPQAAVAVRSTRREPGAGPAWRLLRAYVQGARSV